MTIRPNFSGVWLADFRNSKLEIQAPMESMFRVSHNDPVLLFTRTHKSKDYEDTFSFQITTDGKESTLQKGGMLIHCKCEWKDASLLFHSKMLLDGSEAVNIVLYTLSKDGAELFADEKFTGPPRNYHNQWVLINSSN